MAEKEQHEPHSPDGMIAYVNKWEHDHLARGDAKLMEQEYGRVMGAMRIIGERCAKRMLSSQMQRCYVCKKPVDGMRIAEHGSVWNEALGKHVPAYACSEECAIKLRDITHKQAINLQAAH